MSGIYQFISPGKKKRFFLDNSLNWQLIIINIFLFILFYILDKTGLLSLEFIALNPSLIVEKKLLWTFITSMFMHGSIFHLFVNMLSLFFIGNLIEKIVGKKRYFWIYLFSGIFAGVLFVLLSFVFVGDYNSFAVGASGAIFGLIGVLMFLTPDLRVYLMFIPIPIKLKYAAPGILIVLWLISVLGNFSIGNTAHLGGLLFGLGYGFFLKLKFPKKIKFINKRFS